MKLLLLTLFPLLLSGNSGDNSFTLCTWNIIYFGQTKDKSEIDFIASQIRDFDLVAIQEVVAGPGGAQAVARLADELNRKGSKWAYSFSDPSGETAQNCKRERYAYLWNTSKVKLIGKPWVEKKLDPYICREPHLARFQISGKTYLLSNLHARTYNKNPQDEVRSLVYLPYIYPEETIFILGDFNMAFDDRAFDFMKNWSFELALYNQATTLKKDVPTSGDHLAYEKDNILYELNEVCLDASGIVDFSLEFADCKQARTISDHLPVWGKFSSE